MILATCEQIGGGKHNRTGAQYEQRRARAMVTLLRHTPLRISDVAALRKDAVSWDAEKSTWRVRLNHPICHRRCVFHQIVGVVSSTAEHGSRFRA